MPRDKNGTGGSFRYTPRTAKIEIILIQKFFFDFLTKRATALTPLRAFMALKPLMPPSFYIIFLKNLFLFQKLCNFAKLTMIILRSSKVKQI